MVLNVSQVAEPNPQKICPTTSSQGGDDPQGRLPNFRASGENEWTRTEPLFSTTETGTEQDDRAK